MTSDSPSSSATPAARPFILTRTFNAPRDLVFRAWTDPEYLKHWWGPKGVTVTLCNMDLRPGGRFHYCMHTQDGVEIWGRWIFREITPPERLVFVSSFSNLEGGISRHPMSPTWPAELLSTITFATDGAQTTVTIHWIPLNPSEVERQTFDAAHDSMRMGWGGSFDGLEAYLAKL